MLEARELVLVVIAVASSVAAILSLYYKVRRNYDSIKGAKKRIAELEEEMDRVNIFLKVKYPEFKRDTYRPKQDY